MHIQGLRGTLSLWAAVGLREKQRNMNRKWGIWVSRSVMPSFFYLWTLSVQLSKRTDVWHLHGVKKTDLEAGFFVLFIYLFHFYKVSSNTFLTFLTITISICIQIDLLAEMLLFLERNPDSQTWRLVSEQSCQVGNVSVSPQWLRYNVARSACVLMWRWTVCVNKQNRGYFFCIVVCRLHATPQAVICWEKRMRNAKSSVHQSHLVF